MSAERLDGSEEFPDVMLDMETSGLDKGRTNIIQIAAVRFNLAERTICHDFFNRALLPVPGRFWDESTRAWWLKDKRAILEGIMSRMEDPKTVLQALTAWAGKGKAMWGKPTHFDHSFLDSYYSDFGLQIPFHYRKANDMNSWIRARYFPQEDPNHEWNIPFEGDKHNALMDCLHQIKTLFHVADETSTVIIAKEYA